MQFCISFDMVLYFGWWPLVIISFRMLELRDIIKYVKLMSYVIIFNLVLAVADLEIFKGAGLQFWMLRKEISAIDSIFKGTFCISISETKYTFISN